MFNVFTKRRETDHQQLFEARDIPRYPPFLKGLPSASPQQLQSTQQELLARLQQALGLNQLAWNELMQPSIDRLTAYVHLLPASEHHHHHGAGGLLRHSLEVAFWSVQAAEGVIFVSGGTPLEKKSLEPRWRVAAALAGLFHDIGKPVSGLSVTDKEGRFTWNPFLETLFEWAERHFIDRYFIHWREQRCKHHEQFSVLALNRIMTSELLAWLTEPGPEILQAMLAAIGKTDQEHVLSRLVIDADRRSVERDLRTHRMSVGENALGIPVERYLIDAMRRLLSSSQWLVNQRNARVWVLNEGAFVVWKPAAKEITELLAADKIPGIPRDPDTLADILIERGYAQRNGSQNNRSWRYWPVTPDGLIKDGDPVRLMMLKLSDPEILFTAGVPPNVAATVGEPEGGGVRPRAARVNDKPIHDRGLQEQVLLPEVTAPDPPTINESQEPSTNACENETPPESASKPGCPLPDDLSWLGRASSAIHAVDQQVVIAYPNGIKHWIEPKRFLARLSELDWLALDPAFPARKVRTLRGVRGLVLTEKASRIVSSAIDGTSRIQPSVKNKEIPDTAITPAPPKSRATRQSSIRRPILTSAQSSDKDNKKRRATDFVKEFVTLLIGDPPQEMQHGSNECKVPTETVVARAREQGIQPGELFRALIRHSQCRLQDHELHVQPASGHSVASDDEQYLL